MSLSVSLRPVLTQKLTFTQKLNVGETVGDIPLFSLHRIKSVSERKPIGIHTDIENMLSVGIINQNREYREETDTNRFCIPANYLVEIVDEINSWLKDGIDMTRVSPETKAEMHEARVSVIKTIQKWFDDNFDDLLYDMSGNIPWKIVLLLRKRLKQWIDDVSTNPFNQGIEDAVLETARENGINTDNPEEAWKKMGGKIFEKKKRDRGE